MGWTAACLLGAAVAAAGAPLSEGWAATPLSAPAPEVGDMVAEPVAAEFWRQATSRHPVAESAVVGEPQSLGAWARGLLGAVAALAVLLSGSPRAARAEGPGGVQLYFGQGCFWHVQYETVKSEVKVLNRNGNAITAVTGYAGGTKVGDKGRVCYHNFAGAPDYGSLGHTEVVGVVVPEEKVGDFAKAYFDEAAASRFGRHDPQDMGPEYRSAIGVPGGMDGPLFKQLEAVNAGRMELVRGEGNDSDTVMTKKIWVYDSDKFPFFQAEVYHQFHDDMSDKYSEGYHKLKQALLDSGRLHKVDCPETGFF